MTNITELMPSMDDWPEWAVEAANEGRLFHVTMDRLNRYKAALEEIVDLDSDDGHKCFRMALAALEHDA